MRVKSPGPLASENGVLMMIALIIKTYLLWAQGQDLSTGGNITGRYISEWNSQGVHVALYRKLCAGHLRLY